MITLCGAAFSLSSERMPPPWKTPKLDAGEIGLNDARVLNVIWIDAREKADYDTGHIPGAVLLNELNWEDGLGSLVSEWLSDTRPIIVYCSSRQCDASKRIAQQLREALPEAEIYSLKGGWEAWVK